MSKKNFRDMIFDFGDMEKPKSKKKNNSSDDDDDNKIAKLIAKQILDKSKPKKERKPRTMTDLQKEEMKERLRIGREKSLKTRKQKAETRKVNMAKSILEMTEPKKEQKKEKVELDEMDEKTSLIHKQNILISKLKGEIDKNNAQKTDPLHRWREIM
jgi:hypothetical protein